MTHVAPRIVNNVSCVSRINHEIHFSWQAASSALQQPVFDESADPVAYDEDFPSYPEEEEVPLELENARNQILADLREEERAQERRDFERNIGMVEPDLNSEEEDEIRRRYFGPLGDDIE